MLFQDGDHGPADGQAGAIQRVDQTRLPLPVSAVADAGPAGLEIAEVGAGGDLAECFLRGEPDLEIVGPGGGETEVPGAQFHDAVMQIQFLEDFLGVGGE